MYQLKFSHTEYEAHIARRARSPNVKRYPEATRQKARATASSSTFVRYIYTLKYKNTTTRCTPFKRPQRGSSKPIIKKQRGRRCHTLVQVPYYCCREQTSSSIFVLYL